MQVFKKIRLCLLILLLTVENTNAMGTDAIKVPPTTALFLINNAGTNYDQFIPIIKDNLISLLTQKGFSIVSTENTIPPSGLPDSNENKSSNPEAEASINRLAENLNAGLLVLSTINSVTHDENTFDGAGTLYKSDNKTAVDTVYVNLRVYDVGSAKSVYGDSVKTSIRTPIYGHEKTDTVLVNLFHDTAVRVAENITNRVSAINASATVPVSKVSFTVNSNVSSVDVFVDGIVLGSADENNIFKVAPGIHQLKLGKEFLKSWEKTVNIIDGTKFSIQLELSSEGLKRYKDISAFNLAMDTGNTTLDIAKQQSETDVKVKVEIAKGERKKRENSYIKDDGFADNLNKISHGD